MLVPLRSKARSGERTLAHSNAQTPRDPRERSVQTRPALSADLDFGPAQAKSVRKETYPHACTDRRSACEAGRSSSGARWSRGDRNSTHASWSLEAP